MATSLSRSPTRRRSTGSSLPVSSPRRETDMQGSAGVAGVDPSLLAAAGVLDRSREELTSVPAVPRGTQVLSLQVSMQTKTTLPGGCSCSVKCNVLRGIWVGGGMVAHYTFVLPGQPLVLAARVDKQHVASLGRCSESTRVFTRDPRTTHAHLLQLTASNLQFRRIHCCIVRCEPVHTHTGA